MTNITTVKVDISNPFPSSQEVYSHELNYGLTRFIDVEFYDNSQTLDFTGVTVTATIVCNGCLVAEDIAVSSVTNNVVRMLISSTANYTILAGLMYIEFKFKEGNTELYPPVPVVINVKPSIRDNAQVTPESYGTVSEILQEVATARGNFNSLDARLDNIESDVENVESRFPIQANDIDRGVIDITKLDSDVLEMFGEKLSYDVIKNGINPVNLAYLNSLTSGLSRLEQYKFYYMTIADDVLPEAIIDDVVFYSIGDLKQLIVTSSGNAYYRTRTTIGGTWTAFTKNTAEIESDISTLKYNSAQAQAAIIRLNGEVDEKADLPAYSLGFDSNGAIKSRANVTGLTTLLSGCDSVYTSPKCTTLTSQFKSVNPDLTDIYVDNYSEDMTIDSSITSDTDITIHYRGTFKLIDLLTASQLALANRVGQANTIIENALNGVS